jgi:hypothetical protein
MRLDFVGHEDFAHTLQMNQAFRHILFLSVQSNS